LDDHSIQISDAGRTELSLGTITAFRYGPTDDALIGKVIVFMPMLN